MKRFLSLVAVLALFLAVSAVATAQDKEKPKDKPEPAPAAKDKAEPEKSEKAKTEKGKTEKEKPAEKAPAAAPLKAESTPYYPLQVGNKWHYKVGDNRYTLTVAKYEKIGELDCARVEQTVEDKVVAFEHIAVTKDGVVRVAYDDRRADPPLLFLKLPAKKDASWNVESVVGKTAASPGEKVTATFKAGEVAKLMVPAGTSENVISVSTQDLVAAGQKMGFTYYFGKNVGMLKQEIDVAGTKVVIELEKYEPAAPPKQ
jgi:hypothetical protein